MACMRLCLKLSIGIHGKELPVAVSEDLSPCAPHTEVENAWISIFQINPMLRELETLHSF